MRNRESKSRWLVVPGAENWELWRFTNPTDGAKVGESARWVDLGLPKHVNIALPATDWFLSTARLSNLEEDTLGDMAYLQLEAAGIIGRDRDNTVWDYRVISKDENFQLVQLACLNSGPLSIEELDVADMVFGSFEVFAFESNAVTVWKELSRWNCAVAGRNGLIAAQRLASGSLPECLLGEIVSLLAQMEMENLEENITQIALWDTAVETELVEAFTSAGLSLAAGERAKPVWPSSPLSLLPLKFTRQKEKTSQQKKYRQLAFVGMIALLLVAIGFFIQTTWIWYAHENAAAFVRRSAKEVRTIRESAQRWNSMAPAVDPNQSALEMFYLCARHLPPQGVCFTLFDYKPQQILIVGEANSVPGVVEFQNNLSKDKELSEYQWKIPPPRILPNNVARFEITGTKKTYAFTQNSE